MIKKKQPDPATPQWFSIDLMVFAVQSNQNVFVCFYLKCFFTCIRRAFIYT